MLRACGILLWQTSVFTLVLCHWLTIRTLWRLLGRQARRRLAGAWACMGLMTMLFLSGVWRLRVGQTAAEASTERFFFWSVVGFALTMVVALDLRRLFTLLQKQALHP